MMHGTTNIKDEKYFSLKNKRIKHESKELASFDGIFRKEKHIMFLKLVTFLEHSFASDPRVL